MHLDPISVKNDLPFAGLTYPVAKSLFSLRNVPSVSVVTMRVEDCGGIVQREKEIWRKNETYNYM
jgi:hypothetical protein